MTTRSQAGTAAAFDDEARAKADEAQQAMERGDTRAATWLRLRAAAARITAANIRRGDTKPPHARAE
ncbi:hypothetical protein ABZ769_35495 [Streptomyces olivoreticuli]